MRSFSLFVLMFFATSAHAQEGMIRYAGTQTTKIDFGNLMANMPEEAMTIDSSALAGITEMMENLMPDSSMLAEFSDMSEDMALDSTTAALMARMLDGSDADSTLAAMMSQVVDEPPQWTDSGISMSMDYEMSFSGESVLTKVVLPDFIQSASNLMKTMPGAEPGMTPFSGGMGGALDIQSTIYVDYEQGIVEYPAPSFMAEPYVVSSKLEPLNWTITDQDSTILGYAVQHATASQDTLEAEAWYASELASPAGPMTFGGLPGVVLHLVAEVSALGSTVQFELVADSISTAISAPVAPPTGVRISQEDYQAIVMKRLEGMQKQFEERLRRRESQQ